MAEYISKDRAKHFLCEHCNEVCPDEPCEPEDCDWMHRIDKEPAADVSPVRHGRWNESRPVLRRVNRTNIPVVECSVCGIIFCDLINNHRFTYQFCPHCGARMDGGEQ